MGDASLDRHMQTTSGLVDVALQRGLVAGHAGCAIFLPGEEVRCIHPGDHGRPYCAGVLFTNGPESTSRVRIYEELRFNERRRTPRGNYKCQKGDRRAKAHWLEVESHMVSVPGAA